MSIDSNYRQILEKTKGVKLLVVSKYHTVEEIKKIYDLGQRDFGENKVQDMIAKQEQLPKDINWHLIGHLQKNKVKYIIGKTCLIHSLDSIELAEEINKRSDGCVTECLVQLNSTGIEERFGVPMDKASEFLQQLKAFENIKIRGFMGMAPITDNPDRYFKALKKVFDENKDKFENPVLSMGMSSDFESAINNGSTLVRLGSIIFRED